MLYVPLLVYLLHRKLIKMDNLLNIDKYVKICLRFSNIIQKLLEYNVMNSIMVWNLDFL